MSGYDTREKVCPPSRPLDVFDHPTLTNTEARVMRSALTAIPGASVSVCFFSRGMFHVSLKFSPNGALTTITAPTMSQVVEDAIRIATQLGQEAA